MEGSRYVHGLRNFSTEIYPNAKSYEGTEIESLLPVERPTMYRHVVIKSEAGVFPAMLTPKKPIPRLGYHHRLNAIKELYDTILQSVVLFQPGI